MAQSSQYEIGEDEAGQRLDRWIRRRFPHLTQGWIQKRLRRKDIRVDNRRAEAAQRLEAGQVVRMPPLPREEGERPPAAQPSRAPDRQDRALLQSMILHQDDQVIVLNKPHGLAVQGGSGQKRHLDGLLEGLKGRYPEKPRLTHRLDRDTSGVLLLARSRAAADFLTRAFREKQVLKIYWALAAGWPEIQQGTIDLPLRKAPGRGGERVVVDEDMGKKAISDYAVIDHAGRRVSWLALSPRTGRTHQLRVHCAAIGHPILGDGKYGQRGDLTGSLVARKLHLHARALDFPHPGGGRRRIVAPLPAHMEESFARLGFDAGEQDDPFAVFDAEGGVAVR